MENSKIDVLQLNNAPLDDASIAYAKEIAAKEGVEEVILFPDSFTKSKYVAADYKVTVPSSVAIVTDSDHLYPSFRSRGINCGMMIIALPLKEEDLNGEILDELKKVFTYSLPYYIAYRLRLPFFKNKYDLSYDEFLKVLEKGPKSLKDKYKVSDQDLSAFEKVGSEDVDLGESRKYFNPSWLTKRTVRMRHSFGRYFGGNHYFELQVVEDPGPSALGLRKGQIVAMVHTGCQSLEDVVREDLRENFIRKSEYKSVGKDTEMYKAFFLAQSVLTNFIHSYRLATFAMVRDVIEKVTGRGDSRIVLERGHNHVSKEGDKLIYRHNAERLNEGNFAIVSGNYNHRSYIVLGGPGASAHISSIDHGIGKIIERSQKNSVNTDKRVKLERYKRGLAGMVFSESTEVPLIENSIVSEYFRLMSEKGIVKGMATLRPIFNLKYM